MGKDCRAFIEKEIEMACQHMKDSLIHNEKHKLKWQWEKFFTDLTRSSKSFGTHTLLMDHKLGHPLWWKIGNIYLNLKSTFPLISNSTSKNLFFGYLYIQVQNDTCVRIFIPAQFVIAKDCKHHKWVGYKNYSPFEYIMEPLERMR